MKGSNKYQTPYTNELKKGKFAHPGISHRGDGGPSKKHEDNPENWLNHNDEARDLGSFSLDVRVPIISFEEVRKVTNPSRSRFYKGRKVLPLKKLIKQKAEDEDFMAYYQ